jgi:chromosome segregation ATPase
MSRPGVDYETVKQTAVKLLSQGIAPSVQKIREELGTGSNTTIADHLKVWRDEYAKKTIHHLPANMPKELISTFEVLWQTAMEHAQNQLAEYKKAVESECEAALQKEKEAEKAVADIQLKLEGLSCTLENEISNKQKIAVELAIANDRLIKQEEALTAQKNQYEDRLKRVYEEKDNLITECQRLQVEIKTLHEKLASQAEEHKRLLAQQNSLQEQSETRWLKLIDQARQETKDERKKLENICHQNNEQIKKLESQLTNAQREIHENDVHLKNAQERITQLRQEVKFIEAEYIKARATIMKFEEEKKQKAISHSSKKSKKNERLNKETILQE